MSVKVACNLTLALSIFATVLATVYTTYFGPMLLQVERQAANTEELRMALDALLKYVKPLAADQRRAIDAYHTQQDLQAWQAWAAKLDLVPKYEA